MKKSKRLVEPIIALCIIGGLGTSLYFINKDKDNSPSKEETKATITTIAEGKEGTKDKGKGIINLDTDKKLPSISEEENVILYREYSQMLFMGKKENLEHEEVQYAGNSNGKYWYEAIMMIKNNTKETINTIRVEVKLFDNKGNYTKQQLYINKPLASGSYYVGKIDFLYGVSTEKIKSYQLEIVSYK